MKVYIAGPMAGYPEFNYPAFNRVEDALLRAGESVVNPAKLDGHDSLGDGLDPEGGTGVTAKLRAEFLKRDFAHLATCDAIAMLPGWEYSTGANAELLMARIMDLSVFVVYDDGGRPPIFWHAPTLSPLWTSVREHVTQLDGERR